MEDIINSLFGFLDFSEGLSFEALLTLIVFALMLELFGLACSFLGRIK